nr:hypothetical protein [Desulfurobacterium thermolithotrophum]
MPTSLKLKLIGGVLLLLSIFLFFFFTKQESKELSINKVTKKVTNELQYSILLPKFSISMKSKKEDFTLTNIKFSKTSVYILASNKTYSYFSGTSPKVLIKKSDLIIIQKPNGVICNGTATMEASRMVIDTKLQKVIINKLKVKKGKKLVIGTTKEKDIEFEKICSFIENRRKSPF